MKTLLRFGAAAFLGLLLLGASSPKDAPDFTLPDVGGKPVKFSEITKDKKAVLINFWATWCPACRKEIPELAALQKRLGDKGFAIVGVDVGEPAARVTAYLRKQPVNYPVLVDAQSQTAKSYGVVGLPESVLIDARGKIVGDYHEYSDKMVKDIERQVP